MKSQLEKEEEREKVPLKKKERLEEEIRKYVKERMNEVEDPHPLYLEGLEVDCLVGWMPIEIPMDETHLDDPNLILCSY